MKKFFSVFAVAIALFAATAQAQEGMPAISKTVFSKGDNIASLTIGYGWGFGQRLVWEHGVADWFDGRLTVGVGAAVSNCLDFGYHCIDDRIGFGAVASCHYQFIDKLDTYVQVGLGAKVGIYNYDENYWHYVTDYTYWGIDWTSSLGARWYFNDNFAVNAELGYTAGSYIMAGVTWKF